MNRHPCKLAYSSQSLSDLSFVFWGSCVASLTLVSHQITSFPVTQDFQVKALATLTPLHAFPLIRSGTNHSPPDTYTPSVNRPLTFQGSSSFPTYFLKSRELPQTVSLAQLSPLTSELIHV